MGCRVSFIHYNICKLWLSTYSLPGKTLSVLRIVTYVIVLIQPCVTCTIIFTMPIMKGRGAERLCHPEVHRECGEPLPNKAGAHGCPCLAHLCSPLPIYPLPPGFLPGCSLGPGQVGHLNLGQDVSSLRFFAICGLQEGFEPFAINMQRPVTTWFSKGLPQFEAVPPEHPHYEVRTNPTQHPQICFHTSFSPQFSSPSYSLSSVNVRPQT